jgi:hypothetical protein
VDELDRVPLDLLAPGFDRAEVVVLGALLGDLGM